MENFSNEPVFHMYMSIIPGNIYFLFYSILFYSILFYSILSNKFNFKFA